MNDKDRKEFFDNLVRQLINEAPKIKNLDPDLVDSPKHLMSFIESFEFWKQEVLNKLSKQNERQG